MMFYLTVIEREGYYLPGDVLFVSETISVDVTFTSNGSVRKSGFTLDIRSTSCTEAAALGADIEICDETVEEVMVPGGGFLQDALATYRGNDGNYPNNACQYLNIITDENWVHIIYFYI